MPFCSKCGNAVAPADRYCAGCGGVQPPTAAPRAASDPLAGINSRTASILCYVPMIGWIAAVVVLSADKFRHDRNVRFNAFQGLYLFVASMLNKWVLGSIPWRHFSFDNLVWLAIVGASIFMMIKAAHEEVYSLPLIGELAARSMDQD
jgi:uncharacterized membrane protein